MTSLSEASFFHRRIEPLVMVENTGLNFPLLFLLSRKPCAPSYSCVSV